MLYVFVIADRPIMAPDLTILEKDGIDIRNVLLQAMLAVQSEFRSWR